MPPIFRHGIPEIKNGQPVIQSGCVNCGCANGFCADCMGGPNASSTPKALRFTLGSSSSASEDGPIWCGDNTIDGFCAQRLGSGAQYQLDRNPGGSLSVNYLTGADAKYNGTYCLYGSSGGFLGSLVFTTSCPGPIGERSQFIIYHAGIRSRNEGGQSFIDVFLLIGFRKTVGASALVSYMPFVFTGTRCCSFASTGAFVQGADSIFSPTASNLGYDSWPCTLFPQITAETIC